MYGPDGTEYAGQWKPACPQPHPETGKPMKYVSARGAASRLDVHPMWTTGDSPAIRDPDQPLYITEGVKKADSLTSRGLVTIALAGVFNWRAKHGTLPDWEDVALRDREVWLVFDSDALIKPSVAQAMGRLGKWIKGKGARKVWYAVVPGAINGLATKGIDDFLSAGGTISDLERAAETKAPTCAEDDNTWTDSKLAERLAQDCLDGRFIYVDTMGWLTWDGRRWDRATDVSVAEAVRSWVVSGHADASLRLRFNTDASVQSEVDGWYKLLSAARQKAVLGLARGVVERKASDLDADPEVLNTPSGVVNLRTGDVVPHDPDMMLTKITSGGYRPGFTHEDWIAALGAVPEDIRPWWQIRMGQAITGESSSDGVICVMLGGGENGKSAVTTDGVLPAVGDYGSAASTKLFGGNEHSTERADLQGRRFVIAEELAEGRSLNVTAIKQVADVGTIKARYMRKDNIEFRASHSLFVTTNYRPVVSETDDGTWRRLALVTFPYRFRKPGEPLETEFERRGDPTLKKRIKRNISNQHDAIVTWLIDGAIAWYRSLAEADAAREAGEEVTALADALPERVRLDTLEWRKEADRVLGYWSEYLITDPHAVISGIELHETFNAWLKACGHSAWSQDTFTSRFSTHTMYASARITRNRVRSGKVTHRPPASTSSDPFAGMSELPKQVTGWSGVRWRTEGEME
jgi:P4 family phage/plasmid primase-like protien